MLPLEGDRKPFPFLDTESVEAWGALSPVPDSQGHLWMAYSSNETGRAEIYLRPFLPSAPDGPAGSKVRVSTEGGINPRWRRESMAVDVKLGGTAEIGTPRTLFERPFSGIGYDQYVLPFFAPFSDGGRFLFIERAGELPVPKIKRRVELDCGTKAVTRTVR